MLVKKHIIFDAWKISDFIASNAEIPRNALQFEERNRFSRPGALWPQKIAVDVDVYRNRRSRAPRQTIESYVGWLSDRRQIKHDKVTAIRGRSFCARNSGLSGCAPASHNGSETIPRPHAPSIQRVPPLLSKRRENLSRRSTRWWLVWKLNSQTEGVSFFFAFNQARGLDGCVAALGRDFPSFGYATRCRFPTEIVVGTVSARKGRNENGKEGDSYLTAWVTCFFFFLFFFLFFLLEIVFIVVGESLCFDVVEENLSSIRWIKRYRTWIFDREVKRGRAFLWLLRIRVFLLLKIHYLNLYKLINTTMDVIGRRKWKCCKNSSIYILYNIFFLMLKTSTLIYPVLLKRVFLDFII